VNAEASFPLRVAGLTIDPVRRRVSGPSGEAMVEPLVMQLLLHLVDRRGEVLNRRDLFDHLWGNAQVGDDSLNRLVGSLRKALQSAGAGEVEIETIPRVGYRLIIEPMASDAAQSISRRSVVTGIAASVVALGGAGLWVARRNAQVAEAKRLTDRGDTLLFDAAPTQAGDALPPLTAALDIDPDNARGLGLLALTEETCANNGGSNPGDTLRHAAQVAREALKRDPSEPHARLAIIDMTAGSLTWAQWEDRLEALRASAPGNLHVLGALATLLQSAGRTSRSWMYNERAAAEAPASPTPQWRRVLRFWTAGHTEQALDLSERLLPLWPQHSMVWNARFMVLSFTGRTGAALAMIRNPVAPSANAHPATLAQWLPTLDAFADPSPSHIAKARDANLAAAKVNHAQAAYAAMILSQLDEVDAAFDVINALLLNKGPMVTNRPIVPHSFAANSASWCRTNWLFMPPLAAVRADARFQGLCDEIGLTSYWRQRGVQPDTQIPA